MGPLLPDEFNPETFPMLRVLPGLVVRTLRKHFYAGVKEAEVRFRYHRADEDAVTGALGERLIEPEPIAIQVGPSAYLWRTASYKLRGRGAHAPEKELGADGIFQIEVLDLNGKFVVRKGLLFQSKIGWTGRDGRLFEQARSLVGQSDSAIVIDYSPEGYKAIPVREVIIADGNRERIRPEDDKSLAEVLGDEFVGCRRGDRGMYWEPETERLVVHGEETSDLLPEQLILNRIERLQ